MPEALQLLAIHQQMAEVVALARWVALGHLAPAALEKHVLTEPHTAAEAALGTAGTQMVCPAAQVAAAVGAHRQITPRWRVLRTLAAAAAAELTTRTKLVESPEHRVVLAWSSFDTQTQKGPRCPQQAPRPLPSLADTAGTGGQPSAVGQSHSEAHHEHS